MRVLHHLACLWTETSHACSIFCAPSPASRSRTILSWTQLAGATSCCCCPCMAPSLPRTSPRCLQGGCAELWSWCVHAAGALWGIPSWVAPPQALLAPPRASQQRPSGHAPPSMCKLGAASVAARSVLQGRVGLRGGDGPVERGLAQQDAHPEQQPSAPCGYRCPRLHAGGHAGHGGSTGWGRGCMVVGAGEGPRASACMEHPFVHDSICMSRPCRAFQPLS